MQRDFARVSRARRRDFNVTNDSTGQERLLQVEPRQMKQETLFLDGAIRARTGREFACVSRARTRDISDVNDNAQRERNPPMTLREEGALRAGTRGLSRTFRRRGEPTRTTRIQRGLSRVCLARCREIGDAYNNSRHGMQREPLQRERLRSRHCRRMMTQSHSPHPPRLRNDDALRVGPVVLSPNLLASLADVPTKMPVPESFAHVHRAGRGKDFDERFNELFR
ncbi:hypothetical protein E4U28_000228, partial [Claviceps purpurea]